MLIWDDSYALALALKENHPEVNLDNVSLEMIYQWTIDLPGFNDDVELVNDDILQSIYQEWFEEMESI